MRSSIEFKIEGKTHDEIISQVQRMICDYLEKDSVEDAMSAVDVEVKVQQDGPKEKTYTATAHVRIK